MFNELFFFVFQTNASELDVCLQKTELAVSSNPSNEDSGTSVQLPTNNDTPPETEQNSQNSDESEKNSVSTNELETDTNIESQVQKNSHDSQPSAGENEPKSLTTEL